MMWIETVAVIFPRMNLPLGPRVRCAGKRLHWCNFLLPVPWANKGKWRRGGKWGVFTTVVLWVWRYNLKFVLCSFFFEYSHPLIISVIFLVAVNIWKPFYPPCRVSKFKSLANLYIICIYVSVYFVNVNVFFFSSFVFFRASTIREK